MKKRILIIIAGVLGVNILSFLYYAFVYYPPMKVGGFPNYAVQGGYMILRFALCVGFCWWLASYVNRGRELNARGAFLRFIRCNWIAIAALVTLFFLHNTDNPFREWMGDLAYGTWDLFANRNMVTVDDHIRFGAKFLIAPIFIVESFLPQSVHYFWFAGFFVYRYRRARYMPDVKTPKAAVEA